MQPSTSLGVTLATVVCIAMWVAWLTSMKRMGKLRWELFYVDFLVGALITAWAAGLSLGTIGTEITFRDNIAIVGYRQLAYAMVAGALFALGTIMLTGAVSVAGAAVAAALTGSVALIVGTLVAYFATGGATSGVQFSGIAIAVALFAIVFRFFAEAERLRKKDATHKTPMRRKVEAVAPGVVMVLCMVAGIGFGSFLPLIDWARGFDLPMTAFPITALFATGMFFTGAVLNLYFLNLPLQGDPISPLAYFRIPIGLHVSGLIGGILFTVGTAAFYLLIETRAEIAPRRGVLVVLFPIALGLFSVLGRVVWKEYEEALYRTKTLFFAAGLVVVAASLAVIAGYL